MPDKPKHALFSPGGRHGLLGAFQDLVGLREGPAEVVRALMARMPGSHGVEPAPKLRKVVHHAQRHAHHRALNAREGHRSKRFLQNQAPLALAQFGVEKLDPTQTLESFCTPCMDQILSAAAGVVSAVAPLFDSLPEHRQADVQLGPKGRADPRDFVLMAQYLPATCLRASSTGEVCIAAPIDEMSRGKSLGEFAEPQAVCGECGLSRARVTVAAMAAGYPDSNDRHTLHLVAGAAQEPYAASWELDHACDGNGDERKDICYIPALDFLAELTGNGNMPVDVAMTRRFTKVMSEKHIHACLHSLGKHQPWLKGMHDEFVQPEKESVCVPECKAWLTALEAEHGCCAPHLAAQRFAYSCPPGFEGSCLPFTAVEADEAVAELGKVCEFAPPACPACGDAIDFVVPAPLGKKTDLSAENTHALADALRADLAAQTGEHIRVTIPGPFKLEKAESSDEYFLHAAVELGSAPCWRSKFVGDQLRKEVAAGTLTFSALSAALGNVKDPVVAPPITAEHTVRMSLVLSGEIPGGESEEAELASDLQKSHRGGSAGSGGFSDRR